MARKRYEKLKVRDISIDHRYQRDLDERRVELMAKALDEERLGVPVVARRADGKLVRIDGQHRLAAMEAAGHGDSFVHCEVHEGLTLQQEAQLFLNLNQGRKAVRVLDKYKARLIAEEPVALAFTKIVRSLGLRIGPTPQRNQICAVQAVEWVHKHNRNLETTLAVLKEWGDGDPSALDGELIKDMSWFLSDYEEQLDVEDLGKKLKPLDPAYVQRRIKGMYDALDRRRRLAANAVLREVYNRRRAKSSRLPPLVGDDNSGVRAQA